MNIERLRHAAQRAGLLDAADRVGDDGVISEAAATAIEMLLERELPTVEPSEEECRRHYAANPARFGPGESVRARHILFAVTPGVDVNALTGVAEKLLLRLRCPDPQGESPGSDAGASDARGDDAFGGDSFAAAARENSNCPSGASGGDLGWLRVEDCAPEFACELFGRPEVGVLPRLVRSRFGLHVVEVQERSTGEALPWEEVREAVAQSLRRQAWASALRDYLRTLEA